MNEETVYLVMNIIIMIIIIINTIMIYQNNKRLDKANEEISKRIEFLRELILLKKNKT